jgi:hypothetical protein
MRGVLLAAACMAVAIAVTVARPARTPGPLSRDFEAYWAAGAASNAHADPYGKTIWNWERGIGGVDARRDEILPFIGPPHTLLLWRIAARLPYERAAYVWWVVLAASLLALVAAILAASGAWITAFSVFAASVLALSFAPISSDLALGQAALPAFAGAVLSLVLARRALPASVAAATLAFAQPNVSLGLISQLGRNRVTLAMVLGACAVYVLGGLIAGWAWPLTYARAIAEHGDAERFIAIQFGPAAIAYDLGLAPRAAIGVAVAVGAIAVAAAVAVAVTVRDSFARFAAFSALVPFVSGFFHEHDFVVAFAPSLWCAVRSSGAARAMALAGTLLAGFDWLGLAQRPSGVAQCGLLAAAALAAFTALGRRLDLRQSASVGIGVAVAIGAAYFIAVRNPVPVWPDTLGAFHAPLTTGVASIWLAEQRAAGLTAAVPAWGILRAMSLLGCALLATAIYRHSSCCRTA